MQVNQSIKMKVCYGHLQGIEKRILNENYKLYFEPYTNANFKLVHVDGSANRLRFISKGILYFKHLLNDFKQRHFEEVIIENEDIELIENNDFGQISFDKVYINNCPKLKRIHWNAFGKPSDQIKRFDAYNIGDNLLPNLISQTNSDYDLIKLINSLVNCEFVRMNSFHNELQPIKLHKLKKLILSGDNSSYKIESICSYAFYEYYKIKYINLQWNKIIYISQNSFRFRNKNNKTLKIHLHENELRESSFAENSLLNFERPTKLDFTGNQIKYLNENVFKPFF